MAETSLPQDWHQLLERFGRALTGVQSTLERAADLEATGAAGVDVSAYEGQLDAARRQAHGLGVKATAISTWVDTVDTELQASEDLLRVLLTQTEAVRQKLATWAGRAIG